MFQSKVIKISWQLITELTFLITFSVPFKFDWPHQIVSKSQDTLSMHQQSTKPEMKKMVL